MEHLNPIDLSSDKISAMLENFDMATDLSSHQLEVLSKYFKPYLAAQSIPVLQEGNHNNFFCLIYEGKADVVKESASGDKKVVTMLGNGKVFGEVSFFDHSPCSASVVAKEEMTLLVMDEPSFLKLCDDSASVALHIVLKLLYGITQRLRQTTGQLVDRL